MSSLLWQSKANGRYYYTLKPWNHGSMTKHGDDYHSLGSYFHINDILKGYSNSCTFSKRQILVQPARWAAYFVFLFREVKIEMTPEHIFLADFVESIDPNVWVQNRDIVSLLSEGLIKYSSQL